MIKLSFISTVALLVILLCDCRLSNAQQQKDSSEINFSVRPAPEWTALFERNHGWFGGDGIFSLTLPFQNKKTKDGGDSVLLWFSDSMLGDVTDSLQDGFAMINNSVAVLEHAKPDSSSLRFFWKKNADGSSAAVFEPQTPLSQDSEYYWLGDGFINPAMNNDIFIFGYRIKNVPGKEVFGFKQTGNTLIRIPASSKPPFEHTSQFDIPFFQGADQDSAGSFGAAVLIDGGGTAATRGNGYVYIYGIRGKNKEVIVARTQLSKIQEFKKWTFWNGNSWTSNSKDLRPIADRASHEMSVTPIGNGRYLMVFQKDAIGKNVAVRVGSSPAGPFGPIRDIYEVKEDLMGSPTLFPYNAKAHPALSKPGELLISYNINSFKFLEDLKKFPHLYRPRFIKLTYQ